jgi:PAS domain S-box-containing protein
LAENQELNSNSLDLCGFLDESGNLLYITPTINEIIGFEESELTGKSLFALMHPDDREDVMHDCSAVAPGGIVYMEFRLEHKDGSWRSFKARANKMPQQIELRGLTISLRETGDGRQAAEEPENRARFLEALTENSMDIIAVIGKDDRFAYTNRATKLVLGYEAEEVAGKRWQEFVPLKDRKLLTALLEDAAAGRPCPSRMEFRALHKDGSFRHMEGIGKRFSNGVPDGILVNLRDISKRKTMEKELCARNEELEAFAYTISHDLTTPVAVVESYAKTALEADARGRTEAERECLESIIQAAHRMTRLIDSLLQYARAGRIESQAEMVECNEVLREVLMSLSELMSRKGVKVAVSSDMPSLPIDGTKLYQVFLNLIENAIKHGGDRPQLEIEVGVRNEAGRAVFFVKDNGHGIPLNMRKAIFEPFKHVSVSGSTGLGIGLSTVERAESSWGGAVWVESSEGQGSTFFFSGPPMP